MSATDARFLSQRLKALLRLRRLRVDQAMEVVRRRRDELARREQALAGERSRGLALRQERDALNARQDASGAFGALVLQQRAARAALLAERLVAQQQVIARAQDESGQARTALDASRAAWRRAGQRAEAIELQLKRHTDEQARGRQRAQELVAEDLMIARHAAARP